MTQRVCGPCCGAAGIEPISGCWSLSRTGTELRNDIACDHQNRPLWTLSVPKCACLEPRGGQEITLDAHQLYGGMG